MDLRLLVSPSGKRPVTVGGPDAEHENVCFALQRGNFVSVQGGADRHGLGNKVQSLRLQGLQSVQDGGQELQLDALLKCVKVAH